MASPNEPKGHYNPPKLADRFLSWFCKDSWLEPIRGDLYEQYQIDRTNNSLFQAGIRYWLYVFNFLRPFAIKKFRSNSKYYPMFNNVLKTFFRGIRKNPLQSFISISGLSVGFTIVFLTAMWINHHRSFDTFYEKAPQIYKLMTNVETEGKEIKTVQKTIFEVSEAAINEVAQIEGITRIHQNWRWPSQQCFKLEEDKPCHYATGIFADSTFFKVFDLDIISGPQKPDWEPRSIMLSESIAKKLYGDKDPTGEPYKLGNHREVKVKGVFKDIPKTSSISFDYVASLEVYFLLRSGSTDNYMQESMFTTYLLSDANPEELEEQLNKLSILEKYEGTSLMVHPLLDEHLYTDFENGEVARGFVDNLNIIALFALLVLTMTAMNYINLTTAQSSIRGKEIGVRKVNGASGRDIYLQFLFETFLKVCIAIILALVFSYILLDPLNKVIDDQISIRIELTLVWQIIAVAVFTTLLSGVYPAIVMSRFNPIHILKNLYGKKTSKSISRKWLTAAQISISSIIIILTGVFYQQLNFLKNESLGYDRTGIMMLEPTYRHMLNFDGFVNDLYQFPQIKDVGISNANMVQATNITDGITWEGLKESDKVSFKIIGGNNGLVKVFEMELLDGQFFNEQDSTGQVLLTESSVKAMGLENPVGESISSFAGKARVVGVVKDFNTSSLHTSDIPTIIYKIDQFQAGTFYIRYDNNDPIRSIEIIEEQFSKYENWLSPKYKILDEEYEALYKDEMVISKLSSIVMIVAIIVAAIGILGLSTFNILRRYREIGLRKIFGASKAQIMNILSREFLLITLIANLAAWPFSIWVMNKWLSGFAYRIEAPYELLIFNLIITLFVIFIIIGTQLQSVTKRNPSEVVGSD